MIDFQTLVQNQRNFFYSQKKISVRHRKEILKKLKKLIQSNEDDFYEAIDKDFGKSKHDTYLTELSMIYKDIDYYISHLDQLVQPKKVTTHLANQLGSSKIVYDPLGCVLIIGAWNYPYQLSFCPMIAAIAAGNCCIVKPSELPEKTMRLMASLINEHFGAQYLYVVQGGVEETKELLKQRFDKIFFTGSTKVGRIVYEAAAKHLTPVVLELGGKSPAIVTKSASLEVAAKRIVWGKFLNAGQTCVAPDYVYVAQEVKERFTTLLKKYIKKFDYRPNSAHYTQIINQKNFSRIKALVDQKNVVYGGKFDEEKRYISPTLLDGITWEDDVMQEEIFGPVLPILEFDDLKETFLLLRQKEKPLAAYLFSNKTSEHQYFKEELSFGGGCINDVVMHLANHDLPFGGVGQSGMGNYHGIHGFMAFSHEKAVFRKSTFGEPNMKYPPYSESKLKWIKKLI